MGGEIMILPVRNRRPLQWLSKKLLAIPADVIATSAGRYSVGPNESERGRLELLNRHLSFSLMRPRR
jgi:hypothetical protein